MKKQILVLLAVTVMTFIGCDDVEIISDSVAEVSTEETAERSDSDENEDEDVVSESEASIELSEESVEEETEEISEETAEEKTEESLDESAYEVEQELTQELQHNNFKINHIGSFTTLDLNGNAVTDNIFAQKEYTMINVWGTFCGSCIREMPELQEINASLPDNFQMLGIVCDVYTDYQDSKSDALEIIDATGVTYTNLMASEDMSDWFDEIMFVPTTIVVDSRGNVVAELIEGAYVDGYKEIIRQFGR